MGIRDKFKFDLSKTEDKLKLFILISGTLLFILVAAVGGISLTMSPEFCKICHNAMQPEYVTWQVSSHSNIRCVDCHMKEGVVNILIEKVVAMGHLYDYVTGHYKEELPIKMKHPLDDSFCVKCHSVENRNFTLSGDLIVPHELHGEKGVNCVDCHSGVAHGNITGRKVNVGEELSAWTIEDGKKNMAKQFVQPDMDKCVACHMNPAEFEVEGIQSVTFRCEACHQEIFTPDNHADKNWTPTGLHGVTAQSTDKDYKGCVMCHSIGVESEEVSTGDKVRDLAWGNEFCSGCHATLPASHEKREVWMPKHKENVSTKGMKNCQACHSVKAPEGNEPQAPAGLYCNECHWFE